MMFIRSKAEYESDVAAREAEAVAARENFGRLVDEIKTRVRPRNVIEEATSTISAKTSVAAETARRHLQQHPYAIGFTAAMIGMVTASKISSID